MYSVYSGAGAAGLCAARHLTANSNKITVSIFEQSDTIGGTWVYTDNVGRDDRGLPIHSSMYKNLKTNLPKEVMAFPDFPFQERGQSYLEHSEVLEYLHQYSQHFQLDHLVRFNTIVTRVHPLKTDQSTRKAGHSYHFLFKSHIFGAWPSICVFIILREVTTDSRWEVSSESLTTKVTSDHLDLLYQSVIDGHCGDV